ncbi:hypothetical protein [Mycobacterium sp. D16R24]|uniref:hypothetical protein n=1 Tax=Mycobacterium sp. D16R24 TaxID=1855656 RepID=UPI0009938D14|nr:hypothetical protein [Mycobacterium sp. D16R24]
MAIKLLIQGGDGVLGRGYQTRGSVLVNKTADGVELNQIWDEVQQALGLYNDQRSAIASLVSFSVTRAGDAVAQSVASEQFEEATEFGIPTGVADPSYLKIGYTLKDYDKALRATWKYLRDATAEQVSARVTRIFEADNRLCNGLVMQRLFSPAAYTNDQMLICYGLWNGTDSIAPPAHMGKTFASDHTHYLRTASTVLDAEDVELAIRHIREHGYGGTQSAQFLLFVHPEDVETSAMTSWRAGVEYRTGGPLPAYDFIVSSTAPAFLTAEHVQGTPPPPDYAGIPVLGSYAGALVLQSYYIPKGWAAVVASGGPNSDSNPVAVRQHSNPAYQGLRMIPGNGPYPLQDSFFARSIGVGVRHRGAAVAIQITTNASYTAPTIEL